jgi:hypothetical protein
MTNLKDQVSLAILICSFLVYSDVSEPLLTAVAAFRNLFPMQPPLVSVNRHLPVYFRLIYLSQNYESRPCKLDAPFVFYDAHTSRHYVSPRSAHGSTFISVRRIIPANRFTVLTNAM